MKKLLVALCALALMVLPLFAQGGSETAVDDSKPITIEFWTHEDAARQALEEKYIAEYTAQHPNVTINVIEIDPVTGATLREPEMDRFGSESDE